MRTRASALIAGLLIVLMVGVALASNPGASARLQTDDGTPAGTPVDEASPVAEETPEPSGIVTIVMWYQQNEDSTILQLRPIEYMDLVATTGEPIDESEGGRVVFDEERNDGFPRIRVGENNYFDAYPVFSDDPTSTQRWLYFDGDPELRPATMMMQINGIEGEYDGWAGTATFISRGTEQGGIMVIAIAPPAEE